MQIEVVTDEEEIENFRHLSGTKYRVDETSHDYINTRITLYQAIQRNNLLVTSYWSMCLNRTKEKIENILSLASALSHSVQNHVAKKDQQRYCTQQNRRIEKTQQVCQ